jgi:hypothetical protein
MKNKAWRYAAVFLVLGLLFNNYSLASADSKPGTTRVLLCVKGLSSRFTLTGDKATCPKGYKTTVYFVDLKAKKKV